MLILPWLDIPFTVVIFLLKVMSLEMFCHTEEPEFFFRMKGIILKVSILHRIGTSNIFIFVKAV